MSGNGVDLGSIFGLLREVAVVVNRHDARFDQIEARLDRIDGGMAQTATKLELEALRVATKSDFEQLRQELRDYHGAVMGHGMHISEHDERLRPIERHLDLPAG